MFLRILLLIVCLLCPFNAYAVDWTTDPDCLWALTFDEPTGDFLDHCGSNNGDATPTGGDYAPPTRIQGKFFGGAEFNNNGHFVSIGDVTFMDGKDEFTLSFWLNNSEDYSTLEREILRKDGTLNVQDGAGTERVYVWTSVDPLGDPFNVSADNLYPDGNYWISEDGQWHFYTITYDGAEIVGYRDCVEIGSEAKTGTLSNSSTRLVLGRKPPEEVSGPSYIYTGGMDDMMWLDRVIDAGECTDLMTNGIDGSSGHNPTMFKGRNVTLEGVTIGGT